MINPLQIINITYVLNLGLSFFFASNLAKAAWPAILASSVGSALLIGPLYSVELHMVLVDSVNLYTTKSHI